MAPGISNTVAAPVLSFPPGDTPAQVAAILKSELAKYGKLIAEAGIKPATGTPGPSK